MSSEFRLRTLSAIVYASLVFFASLYSAQAMAVFLLMVALFCVFEYTDITKITKLTGLGLTIPLLVFSFLLTNYFADSKLLRSYNPASLYIILLSINIVYSTVLSFDLFRTKTSYFHNRFSIISLLCYVALPFGLLIFGLKHLDIFTLILPYFIFTWTCDVGAYIIGRKWGKTPLLPSVSPKKTIEGNLGALFTVTLAAIAFHIILYTYSIWFWLIFAWIIWLFSSLGDLVESKLKRSYGIKDSSQLIPGHGGFLDRFDGFLFAIPWFLLFVLLYNS